MHFVYLLFLYAFRIFSVCFHSIFSPCALKTRVLNCFDYILRFVFNFYLFCFFEQMDIISKGQFSYIHFKGVMSTCELKKFWFIFAYTYIQYNAHIYRRKFFPEIWNWSGKWFRRCELCKILYLTASKTLNAFSKCAHFYLFFTKKISKCVFFLTYKLI